MASHRPAPCDSSAHIRALSFSSRSASRSEMRAISLLRSFTPRLSPGTLSSAPPCGGAEAKSNSPRSGCRHPPGGHPARRGASHAPQLGDFQRQCIEMGALLGFRVFDRGVPRRASYRPRHSRSRRHCACRIARPAETHPQGQRSHGETARPANAAARGIQTSMLPVRLQKSERNMIFNWFLARPCQPIDL